MKYLTEELYTYYFEGKEYNSHQDKFLIGILNNNHTKLKDVITGEITEITHFTPLSRLKWFKDGGNNMALGYITGFKACDASIPQKFSANRVNSILKKDVLDENDITKLKNIMNKEIRNSHNKEQKREKRLREKEEKLNNYSIEESERDF